VSHYLNDILQYKLTNCWFDVKVHCALLYLWKILKLSELEIDCKIKILSAAELEENQIFLICVYLTNRRHMKWQSDRSAIWQPLVLHYITRWRNCCWSRTVKIRFFHTSFELSVLLGNVVVRSLHCVICSRYIYRENIGMDHSFTFIQFV